jgi:hypothetical protein
MSGLGKLSIGIGDRFGREGAAQLAALQAAARKGLAITPVWNKSNREHMIIGTSPDDARRRADLAVRAADWKGPYFVDADHIGLATVDRFMAACDFFTIDVADLIGRPAEASLEAGFVQAMEPYSGTVHIPEPADPIEISAATISDVARKYLRAIDEAERVYRHIRQSKRGKPVIIEISVDEADSPQTPAELFLILGALAERHVPVQTIAPKFSGSFLKGIDYVGDVGAFAAEFAADLAVVELARASFGLPEGLKLSVHSGSDKFSLYPVMHRALTEAGAGLHLKTAGTTWLEEVTGLASSGGEGLRLAKDLYAGALARFAELAQPYRPVTDIDRARLPSVREVSAWSAEEYAGALRHDASRRAYNPHFRQLIHISFRLAAEMGRRFTDLLEQNRAAIAPLVTDNLLRRHIEPLFLGTSSGPGGDRHPETI